MSSTLSHIVMRRVRRVYYLKRVLHPTMVKMYGAFVAIVALGSLVSVPNVLANTPGDAAAGLRYLGHALASTEMLVQVTLLLFLVLCGMILRDVLERTSVRTPHFFAH